MSPRQLRFEQLMARRASARHAMTLLELAAVVLIVGLLNDRA
jgi:hypothetical protein